jgi:hypothetical protein
MTETPSSNTLENTPTTVTAPSLNYLKQIFTRPYPSINLTPKTAKEITDIVKSLKSKNSHGYDEISTKVLKLSLPYIISPLIYICKKSLLRGIFPTRLKFSQITPILKKGEKNGDIQLQTYFFTYVLF